MAVRRLGEEACLDLSAARLDVVGCFVELFQFVAGVEFRLQLEVLLAPSGP